MSVESKNLPLVTSSGAEGAAKSEIRTPMTGLCVNCDMADTCNLRLDQKKPIFQCNEHDVAEKKVEENAKETSDVVAETDGGELHFKGLCANCENREYCVFSDDSIGVWHCAEYR